MRGIDKGLMKFLAGVGLGLTVFIWAIATIWMFKDFREDREIRGMYFGMIIWIIWGVSIIMWNWGFESSYFNEVMTWLHIWGLGMMVACIALGDAD